MFFTPSAPADSRLRSLRSAIRDAADLVIAFTTLESYGLDNLWPCRASGPHGYRHPAASTDDAAGRLDLAPGSRADAGATQPLGRPHPHRLELRPRVRARRPGTTIPREHLCLTP